MRKLTPLSIGILTILLAAASITIILMADNSTTDKTVEIWFPERDNASGIGIGNDSEFRVATVVGHEKAVTVVCPAHFVPDLSKTYLASERHFETSDGRLAPPVWTLIVDLDGYPILPRR